MKNNSLLIFIMSLVTIVAHSQDITKFNLPPGTGFAPKYYQEIDYNYKLSDETLNEPIEKNYLFKFSKNELEKTKTKNPETYIYYITADKYFKNLSDFVKSKFTAKELWYIYKCDQKLKNKLLTIK
jgi:hypothetical protein